MVFFLSGVGVGLNMKKIENDQLKIYCDSCEKIITKKRVICQSDDCYWKTIENDFCSVSCWSDHVFSFHEVCYYKKKITDANSQVLIQSLKDMRRIAQQ